ncbi:MAG: C-GCAxxG-C-C family protein [Lachnospiraceae bacterium]|nr:C-GCAxxG-C-C family protein [Lachnospiraceae bacterium]
MGKYLDKAHELRSIMEPHYNCAQSVLIPFAEKYGLDVETAYRIGANFGSGMKMGSVCGAITGGLMVLGLAGLDRQSDTVGFVRRIRENHEGKILCADLLRANAERGGNKKEHCDGLVYEAVAILEEMLELE